MKDKIFKQILELVKSEISEIQDYFSIYNILFERKAKEIKTRSYGGYEITQMVGEFNQALNIKSSELLEKISKVFKELGRKLSAEQYDTLTEKCTNAFATIIDSYKVAFQKEFELKASLETTLNVSKGRISNKFKEYINSMKKITNTKIDKALLCAEISTALAGLSLVVSIIAIVF